MNKNPKNSKGLFKSILSLSTSTGASQALQLLMLPIVLRLYGPVEFGIYSVVIAAVAVLGPVISLRYEQAIITSKTDFGAQALLWICLAVSLILSLIVQLGVSFAGDFATDFFQLNLSVDALGFLAALIFFEGLNNTSKSWLSRFEEYNLIAWTQFVRVLSVFGVQIYLGWDGSGTAYTLLQGNLLGWALVGLIALFLSIRQCKGSVFQFSLWKSEASHHKDFPLFNTWGSFMNFLSLQLPTFLLARFFGAEIVGYYSLAVRVVKAPIGLISNSVSQVYFQKSAIAKNLSLESTGSADESKVGVSASSGLRKLTMPVYNVMLLLSAPILVLMINPNLPFEYVFGKSWAVAGTYSAILAPWFFVWMLYSPFSVVFSVFRLQKRLLNLQVGKLLARLVALLIGGWWGDILVTLILLSAASFLAQIYQGVISTRLAGMSLKDGFSVLKNREFVLALAGLFALSGLSRLLANPYSTFLVFAAVGAYGLYVLRIVFVKKVFKQESYAS